MAEVGKEFTMRLDMGDAESVGGTWGIGAGEDLMVRVEEAFGGLAKGGFHQAVGGINCLRSIYWPSLRVVVLSCRRAVMLTGCQMSPDELTNVGRWATNPLNIVPLSL